MPYHLFLFPLLSPLLTAGVRPPPDPPMAPPISSSSLPLSLLLRRRHYHLCPFCSLPLPAATSPRCNSTIFQISPHFSSHLPRSPPDLACSSDTMQSPQSLPLLFPYPFLSAAATTTDVTSVPCHYQPPQALSATPPSFRSPLHIFSSLLPRSPVAAMPCNNSGTRKLLLSTQPNPSNNLPQTQQFSPKINANCCKRSMQTQIRARTSKNSSCWGSGSEKGREEKREEDDVVSGADVAAKWLPHVFYFSAR